MNNRVELCKVGDTEKWERKERRGERAKKRRGALVSLREITGWSSFPFPFFEIFQVGYVPLRSNTVDE